MDGSNRDGVAEDPRGVTPSVNARPLVGQAPGVPRPARPRALGWAVPVLDAAGPQLDMPDEVVGVSRGPEPDAMLAGYAQGVFPMPVGPGLVAWWSPQPRGVLPLDGLRVSRSLRRSVARYDVTVDAAFDALVRACAAPSRTGRWITPELEAAYAVLHARGVARSVEVWAGSELVGGLFGVVVGGLFAGESMVSLAPDASKVALLRLVEALGGVPGHEEGRVLDVQWATDHLRTLGAVELPRRTYVAALGRATALPPPPGLEAGRRWERRSGAGRLSP